MMKIRFVYNAAVTSFQSHKRLRKASAGAGLNLANRGQEFHGTTLNSQNILTWTNAPLF